MSAIEESIAVLFAKIASTFPGLIGGVLSLRFFKDQSGSARLVTVIGGWACAAFTTDPVMAYFSLADTVWKNGVAFFIGLFGMSIVAAIMGTVKDVQWADIITGWVKK